MRVDLKKFLFVGLKSEQNLFFHRAQEIGVIHFIDPKKKSLQQLPQEILNFSKAIKILKAQPSVNQDEETDFSPAHDIVNEILALEQKHELLIEQKRALTLEISRVAPLGEFSEDDVRWIEKEGKVVIQYFSARHGTADHPDLPSELIYLTTEENLDYFVSFNQVRRQYDKMSEIVPEVSLRELNDKLQETVAESEQIEHRLKSLAKFNDYLHKALIHNLDRHQLEGSTSYAELALDQSLFVIEGWVPATKVELLLANVNNLHLHCEEVAIDEKDAIPTYLENKGVSRIGEDLVHIYDTPSKDDYDPSLWVLCFFALFFAMIVGDAGYGLIMLLIAIYVQRKHRPTSPAAQRGLKLLFILAGAVVGWGILTTSFFGITVSPDNPIRKASLVSWLVEKKTLYHFEHADNTAKEWIAKFPKLAELHSPVDLLNAASTVNPETERVTYSMYNAFANDIMIELALLVGIIHLSLSLLRYVRRNPAALGWIAFLIGGYLYCPKFLNATSISHFVFGIDKTMGAHSGIILMALGMGFAVIVSLFKYGIAGAVEAVMLVVQIFGDSMSYLRLYALGLSGSLITATVNDLVDGMNVVLAAIILIVSHLVNLSLAVMGGVIHGLRLNFLEWYHYSFEGGGKRFNPLKYESKRR
jgi:V/A-type H+-transporting ATPase subunit I